MNWLGSTRRGSTNRVAPVPTASSSGDTVSKNNTFRLRELRGLSPGRLLVYRQRTGAVPVSHQARRLRRGRIEFEPGLAQMASERYGVAVVVGDAVSAPVDGPFDVITMWHVLEHLAEPVAALERAAELLAPGGMLIVSVPNNSSGRASIGGDDWLHLDIPRRLSTSPTFTLSTGRTDRLPCRAYRPHVPGDGVLASCRHAQPICSSF